MNYAPIKSVVCPGALIVRGLNRRTFEPHAHGAYRPGKGKQARRVSPTLAGKPRFATRRKPCDAEPQDVLHSEHCGEPTQYVRLDNGQIIRAHKLKTGALLLSGRKKLLEKADVELLPQLRFPGSRLPDLP